MNNESKPLPTQKTTIAIKCDHCGQLRQPNTGNLSISGTFVQHYLGKTTSRWDAPLVPQQTVVTLENVTLCGLQCIYEYIEKKLSEATVK